MTIIVDSGVFVSCVQAVQLILDQCGGVAVNELEGVGGDIQEVDVSGCRAAGETPGNQRSEQPGENNSPPPSKLFFFKFFSPLFLLLTTSLSPPSPLRILPSPTLFFLLSCCF